MHSTEKSYNRGPWLKEKSNSQKYLILITVIVSIVALALAVALGIVTEQYVHYDDEGPCLTTGCIDAAAKALSYMNTAQDPCDNFYEFACGNFLKKTVIPADKISVNSFSQIRETVRDQLQMIITSDVEDNTSKPFKLLKKYFDLCMNTTAIEKEGLTTIKKILKDFGGWPVLEGPNWNENVFDWKLSVYKFRKVGFINSLFVGFYVTNDNKNSSKNIVTLDNAYLTLSREFLIKGMDDKIVRAYYELLVDVAIIFGADKSAALTEMKEVVEFQIELAKICLPREKRRNSTALYNPMTLEEMQLNFPYVNWMEYIKNNLGIPDLHLTYDELIIVTVPKYLSDLEILLQKTSKRIQSNYVMSIAAVSKIFYLTSELRDRLTDFYRVLSGQIEKPSRWKDCTSFASSWAHFVSGSLYVKKYFKEKSKKTVEEMISNILGQFKKTLNKVDWMDENTRKNALAKANSITTHIGYPDELLDNNKIEQFYASLDSSPDNFMLAGTSLSLFFLEYHYKQLRVPVNKTSWMYHGYPTAVNAFYSANENSIEFPAGILQGVFFNAERPNYMNYGAIGYIIGHEITHAFDDEGRQFDKDGNLNDWWAASTKEAFINKTQCIIYQYGNHTVPEINQKLNGITKQGENIADCGGVKQAYLAYLNWVERNSPEKKLPGLPYTPNQMFWISAAHPWCGVERKEVLKLQVTTGVHSPNNYRVLIPFGNSEYFARDFNCPLGSTMNPIYKCKVW